MQYYQDRRLYHLQQNRLLRQIEPKILNSFVIDQAKFPFYL